MRGHAIGLASPLSPQNKSRAVMHINMDQFEAALALLESKRVYFDQNAGIRVAIGQVHSILKQYDKAVDALRHASLLRPDDHTISRN